MRSSRPHDVHPKRWVLALLVANVAGLAGCAGVEDGTVRSPSPLPAPTTSQQEVIAMFLASDDAQPVMSDAQRQTLIAAYGSGEISFEQYSEAVFLTLDCARGAGLRIDGPTDAVRGGQPVIAWGWADPTQPDGDPRVGEECRAIHSLGIEMAYENSAVAADDERQQLEAFRPALLACLESREASPDDPGMDIYELIDYSNQRGIEPGWQGLDCTTEVNVSVG